MLVTCCILFISPCFYFIVLKFLVVLFCRLWPDVVASDDTAMTTAVNRARAVCLTDVAREERRHSPEEQRRSSGRCADLSPAEESHADRNMSGEKTTSPCNKFQANIFNKSKCQNCFKSRELHLLNDRDMEQVTLMLQ